MAHIDDNKEENKNTLKTVGKELIIPCFLDENAKVPFYAKPGDCGMDITATGYEYNAELDCHVYHTGLYAAVPEGYAMFLFPRSSNRKTNAYLTNHVGVVDSGYRGEILLCFKNRTNINIVIAINNIINKISDIAKRVGVITRFGLFKEPIPYEIGDRICQAVILPYPKCKFEQVNSIEDLGKTERGDGGYGHTGK